MKIVPILVLALNIAAPVIAADFADLQSMKASAISRINPFPDPSNPDSCYLTGIKDGLCNFRCRSGETLQVKPVKPEAASLYEKCGGGDYRGVQPPDAGAIWSQINNQHNPFPQPHTTLDYCVFNDFKNNKCIFKCQSGAILTEPAVKPDFSTGEPSGPCATMIIRPVPAPFQNKAALPDAGSILAQIEQQQQAQQQALISQQMQFALQAAASLRKDLKGYGVKAKVGLVNLPGGRYGLSVEFAKGDDYELVKDMFFQDPGDNPSYMDLKVLVSIDGERAAADKKIKACRLTAMEKDSCVYACNDGSTHTQPMQRPDPWDNQPVIPCPQLVFPF